jgi:hypothetical protein
MRIEGKQMANVITIKPKDSFQKFADDVFGGDNPELFKHVHPQDRDEVRVQFSRMIAEHGNAHDLRVLPLHMSEKFRVGGRPSFSAQVKVGTLGRIYWVGFSHLQARKAA